MTVGQDDQKVNSDWQFKKNFVWHFLSIILKKIAFHSQDVSTAHFVFELRPQRICVSKETIIFVQSTDDGLVIMFATKYPIWYIL